MIYTKETKSENNSYDYISLEPLIPELIAAVPEWTAKNLRWFNDPVINNYNSHAIFPRINVRKVDNDEIVWQIFIDGSYVGNIGLDSISWVNRSAEIAIIIGEIAYHGKGIGRQAMEMVMKHGFEKMNLNRIYLGTASMNAGMMKVAEKIGMKEEGKRRQAIFIENQYDDVIEFGILKQEFEKK